MPIYDIECKDCGFVREIILSSCESKTPRCIKCQGMTGRLPCAPALGIQCQPGIENPGFYKSKNTGSKGE